MQVALRGVLRFALHAAGRDHLRKRMVLPYVTERQATCGRGTNDDESYLFVNTTACNLPDWNVD